MSLAMPMVYALELGATVPRSTRVVTPGMLGAVRVAQVPLRVDEHEVSMDSRVFR